MRETEARIIYTASLHSKGGKMGSRNQIDLDKFISALSRTAWWGGRDRDGDGERKSNRKRAWRRGRQREEGEREITRCIHCPTRSGHSRCPRFHLRTAAPFTNRTKQATKLYPAAGPTEALKQLLCEKVLPRAHRLECSPLEGVRADPVLRQLSLRYREALKATFHSYVDDQRHHMRKGSPNSRRNSGGYGSANGHGGSNGHSGDQDLKALDWLVWWDAARGAGHGGGPRCFLPLRLPAVLLDPACLPACPLPPPRPPLLPGRQCCASRQIGASLGRATFRCATWLFLSSSRPEGAIRTEPCQPAEFRVGAALVCWAACSRRPVDPCPSPASCSPSSARPKGSPN